MRQGLVPSYCSHWSKSPLRLVAANGQEIAGGQKETELGMRFQTVGASGERGRRLIVNGTFHLADIGVDVILSYPWLREKKIGVFPHHAALACAHPEQILLQPLKGGGKGKPPVNAQKPLGCSRNFFACLQGEHRQWQSKAPRESTLSEVSQKWPPPQLRRIVKQAQSEK